MSTPTPKRDDSVRSIEQPFSDKAGHGFLDRSSIPIGLYPKQGRFGRMFPQLKAREDVAPFPLTLGTARGPMDMGGTVEPSNPSIPSGFTFLGQFADHDITFDPTSSLEKKVDPEGVENFRTPAFELDSIYGAGPSVQPYLYDGLGRFLLAKSGIDVPRNEQNVAIIADPRNDENLIITQLHLAFLKFHNALMDKRKLRFEESQREVRWHYQWLLVNHFLPATVGREMFETVFNREGRRWFQWAGAHPFTPLEFSAAAYRFGHSQVRTAYKVSDLLAANVFKMSESPVADDLRGGRSITPDRQIDWSNFFPGMGREPDRSMLIDTRISSPMFRLPTELVRSADPSSRSLVFRNLARGQSMGLPSGQALANCMGVQNPLDDDELWGDVRGKQIEVDEDSPAPLWFYILREAEVRAKGLHLGEVGGRIVAEVFHGFLTADSQSYISQYPNWNPTLDKGQGFGMADLLRFAGVA